MPGRIIVRITELEDSRRALRGGQSEMQSAPVIITRNSLYFRDRSGLRK